MCKLRPSTLSEYIPLMALYMGVQQLISNLRSTIHTYYRELEVSVALYRAICFFFQWLESPVGAYAASFFEASRSHF
jgi:hypothetical protein